MRVLGELLARVEAETPYGGRAVSWEPLGTVWLKVQGRRRRERSEAEGTVVVEVATAEARTDPRLVEGRVIHHQQAVDPPGDARQDWKILCDLARRLGAGEKFEFTSPRQIFDELGIASRGGVADFYGLTPQRIDP